MFFEIVILVIALCFVMRCYHRNSNDPPVSGWMRTLVLDRLSYVVRVRKDGSRRTLNTKEKTRTKDTDNVRLNPMDSSGSVLSCDNDGDKKEGVQTDKLLGQDHIGSKLDFLIQNIKDKAKADMIVQEWRTVGLTFDRCLCVFFFISLILVTISCFSSVPSFDEHIEGE